MGIKEEILKLRNENKSYRQIEKELGCSRSVISYHCQPTQKEKARDRTRKYRKSNTLAKKTDNYKSKCIDFQRRSGSRILKYKNENTYAFTVKDVENKIGENPRCYLTGRHIDICNPKSYQFDHIIPATKGGDNSLNNLGISCREANQAKHDLTLDEFLNLCKDVLEYNGYKVEKQP